MKKFIKIMMAAIVLGTASVATAAADPFETKMGMGFWGQFGFSVPFCGLQMQCWPIKYIGLAVTGGSIRFGNIGYFSVAGDVDILMFQSAFNENNGVRMYMFGQAAYNKFYRDDDKYSIPEYAAGMGAEFVFGRHFGLPIQIGYSYALGDGDDYDEALIGTIFGIGVRARF